MLKLLPKNKEIFLVGLLLLVAVVVRLYKIDAPLADWHSFRQVDTASVTREYVKHGIDLLHPRYHDLSDIQSGVRTGGQDNLEGWRMVEFPIMNAVIATVLRSFPTWSLVVVSRLFSIMFSLGTLLCLYWLAKHVWDKEVALITGLLFALLPYSVFYSRVVLPEPFMLFFSTLSIYLFLLWSKKPRFATLLGSGTALSLAVLLKPYVLFLFPVYLCILVVTQLLPIFKSKKVMKEALRWLIKYLPQFLIFALIAFVPLLWWRNWIQQFPAGIPASDWLFNGNGIRWRPAWFRWLGYERLIKLILGYVGIIFLPLAFILHNEAMKQPVALIRKLQDSLVQILRFRSHFVQPSLRRTIKISWWLGILFYFSVIASGNVQHDYYQVLLIPIVCLTVAVGAVNLFRWIEKKAGCRLAQLTVGTLLLAMLLSSWQQVKGYYNINHWEYIEAGKAVDELTPPDAKVIAPAFGDTVFLFQTNRTGWPMGFNIDKKIANGAQHYVSTSYDDEARELERQYQVVKKTDKFILIDLTRMKE